MFSAFGGTDSSRPGPFYEINEGFTLNSAYLVFFMHCGFAMLSIGCVRAKYAKHISILILLDACASAMGFYLFGYAFAFGDKGAGNAFIGSQFFAMSHLPPSQYYLWIFQWSFAATACTIVSGAIAERTRFEAYILYSFFMSAWVYPLVVHSIWAVNGWASAFNVNNLLFGSGAIDYAGSGAVHMVGGMAALCGAIVVGPRIGRFLPDGTVVQMEGHNTSLFILGVMILWFGWYGFNPGSQLAIVTTVAGSSYSVANAVANAAVTTTISPAVAGLTGLAVKALFLKRETGKIVWDIMCMGNSVLAGLVAITSGCSTILPWGAIIVGGVAGTLYVFASKLMVKLRIDDPLDAIAVHLFNGTWGVIAVGFLAGQKQIAAAYGRTPETSEYGCWLGGSGRLLGAQLVYALWLAGWVAVNMTVFWLVLKYTGFLRVDAADEAAGLDVSHHGGSAYPADMEHGDAKGGKFANGTSNGYNVGGGHQYNELRAELTALKQSLHKQGLTEPEQQTKGTALTSGQR